MQNNKIRTPGTDDLHVTGVHKLPFDYIMYSFSEYFIITNEQNLHIALTIKKFTLFSNNIYNRHITTQTRKQMTALSNGMLSARKH